MLRIDFLNNSFKQCNQLAARACFDTGKLGPRSKNVSLTQQMPKCRPALSLPRSVTSLFRYASYPPPLPPPSMPRYTHQAHPIHLATDRQTDQPTNQPTPNHHQAPSPLWPSVRKKRVGHTGKFPPPLFPDGRTAAALCSMPAALHHSPFISQRPLPSLPSSVAAAACSSSFFSAYEEM